MPKKSSQRLRWNGNRSAQAQADAAFREWRKKADAKKGKTDGPRGKPKRRKSGKQDRGRHRKWTYQSYMHSPQWKRKRRKAFAFYGNKCNCCGSTESLQVHHKTYDNLYREPLTDLEILCSGCHRNLHEGEVPGVVDPITQRFLDLDL